MTHPSETCTHFCKTCYAKAKADKWKSEHKCRRCGEELPEVWEFTRCDECRTYAREFYRSHYGKGRE